MDLQEINPHLALLQSESYVSRDEIQWLSWVDNVAHLLGRYDLDGDQDEDGYSLDLSHDFFVAGLTPQEAADEFRVFISESPNGWSI